MEMSINLGEIASALAQAQSEMRNPTNNATNPFFKSKYAPLNEVINVTKPILSKYGLSFFQFTASKDDGSIGVSTMILHSSGQYIKTDYLWLRPTKDDPQGQGSAITYARRYSLNAALGVVGDKEDDDGNAASEVRTKQEKAKEDFNLPKEEEIELNIIKCADCGKAIQGYVTPGGTAISPEAIAERSTKTYGVPLCVECGKKRKNVQSEG